MKMFLVGFAFAGTLVTGSSGNPVAQPDNYAKMEIERPVASEPNAESARPTRIVNADYQLTDQERVVIAFLRLKADVERDARQATGFARQSPLKSDGSVSGVSAR
jgi:hypothetical protein